MASPLVEAFTEPEKEGLRKFKEEYLDKALSEAAGDSDKSTLEIWGVPISHSADSRVDVIIVKFLRAKYVSLQVCVFEYAHVVRLVNWCCQRLLLSL